MPKRASAPDYCMVARSMELLGEQWTILVIRDAFFGVRHFDDFQRGLGIARNVLSDRLSKLVEAGVLSRQQSETDKRKVEYRLTPKGRDLFPVIVALSQWGKKHLRGEDEPLPFDLIDRQHGEPLAPVVVRAADGRVLTPHDTGIRPGPGLTEEVRRAIPALANAR